MRSFRIVHKLISPTLAVTRTATISTSNPFLLLLNRTQRAHYHTKPSTTNPTIDFDLSSTTFNKHTHTQNTLKNNKNNMPSVIVEPNEENLKVAANKLREGGLVAFPTETVYGLGANALSVPAVLSIFQAKGRPLTDPVIVHVSEKLDALKYLTLTETQTKIFHELTKNFWPGPLTIVGQSSPLIPLIVTADTGKVGVRLPNHPLARQLISLAQLPIAAPSANRFGHVSPTTPQHVLHDLQEKDVTILNGGETACEVGIESTVVRLDEGENDGNVTVLRRGGVPIEKLEQCLKELNVQISVVTRKAHAAVKQEAPGQLLTHYAPDIPAYLTVITSTNTDNNNSEKSSSSGSSTSFPLSEVVLVDFGGRCEKLAEKCLAYRDLSSTRNVGVAANSLFSVLRWSEQVEGAKLVLLPNLRF
eukprot:TRINITY_DN4049_c0_g5_i1.p1 TRINITY_DN4049_c0_g5~~TRINITY_DN4049_c0_g5_i1.p1  ORF type:complete len:418 (-),score=83.68 TRINITY_DN4049_c0_g5_i1:145-1398(-)